MDAQRIDGAFLDAIDARFRAIKANSDREIDRLDQQDRRFFRRFFWSVLAIGFGTVGAFQFLPLVFR
jgi:hypothetical protein